MMPKTDNGLGAEMIEGLMTYLTKFIVMPSIVFFIVFWIVNRRHQKFSFKRKPIVNAISNIALVPANMLINVTLISGVTALANVSFSGRLPQIPTEIWNGAPVFVAVIMALVAKDFANYWSHRLMHTKLLWGVHALHHSDSAMTWTTNLRVHFLEILLMQAVFFVIIGWMNLPVEAVAIVGVLRTWYGFYIHCHTGFTHGKLSPVFCSPNYHRWHHADEPEAYGKNLADMFPVWDLCFGTYYNPGPCQADIGTKDAPEDVILAQAYPFIYWAQMVKDKLSRKQKSAPAV